MDELFDKYVKPNLVVVDAEDSIDGQTIYVSDLDKIKAAFQEDLRAWGQSLISEQAQRDYDRDEE